MLSAIPHIFKYTVLNTPFIIARIDFYISLNIFAFEMICCLFSALNVTTSLLRPTDSGDTDYFY